MMPPTIFVDAREAVQMTRERFACGAEQAAAYLEDQIAAGEIEPDWSEGKLDPGGAFDWFQGVVWRTSTLQDRAIGAGSRPDVSRASAHLAISLAPPATRRSPHHGRGGNHC